MGSQVRILIVALSGTTIAASIGVGLLVLSFFSCCAIATVYITLGCVVVIPAGLGVFFLVTGVLTAAVPLLLVSLVMAAGIYLYRSKLNLCGQLFR